uniref:Leucine carboxyl methyltransferase 1 n=1 Tax=Globodera rostochiensis TaxID=31243 RepID=A0A914GUF6_GLORO
METEADFGSGMLRTEVSHRRRSASVSEDYSVQKTNDDATECKFVAAQLGYYNDKFIPAFIHACTSEKPYHRDPEITRGYWARTSAITSVVVQFIQLAGPSTQILNLGAGFDTLYWRLKDAGLAFYKFVEFDFSSVTAKKICQIKRNKNLNLMEFFSKSAEEKQHSDLHAGDYHLIGSDLRQMREFDGKLATADLDFSQPTIVIAECVFVYMDEGRSHELIEELAKRFETIAVVNYEQVNMTDTFSKVMSNNLNSRGIHLPGLSACKSLQTQKQRFLSTGYPYVQAWTINQIYNSFFQKHDVSRVESLEPLDERELLTQLLEHYCLVK